MKTLPSSLAAILLTVGAGIWLAQAQTAADMPTPKENVPAPIVTPTPLPEPTVTPTPPPAPLGTPIPLPGTTPATPVTHPNSGGAGSTTIPNSIAPTNAAGEVVPNSR